jgi:cation-transporting ATPase E
VKVISGDNAVSVGAVAGSLGLEGETMDARQLPSEPEELADTMAEYTTFGRVRPDQKRAMVHALQSRDHTVAMTGDGVNDVLALKDADIGVAMGSGSPASRAVAQIVLLDNKFATLPYVVGEGRRVIGNIERVSNLFLTKTVYSVLLALLVGLAGLSSKWFGTEPLLYPFQPIHVTIAAWFTIGIPAFILSLAPNNERAHTGFVRRVMTSRAAIGRGRRPGDVHLLSGRLPRPRRHARRAGPGLHRGADHPADRRGVGARGGGPAVPVVAGGAGVGFRRGLRCDLRHPAGAGEVHAGPIEPGRDRNRDGDRPGRCGVDRGHLWWIQGRVLGEPRILWRTEPTVQD